MQYKMCISTQSKQERPDEAIGRHASDTAVRLRDQTERVQNKHDPAKQLKKAGTVDKELLDKQVRLG